MTTTVTLIFETRRNINETRDRRFNPREKSPVVVHRQVVPFDLSFLFFTLLRGFRLAGIPAAVRSGPQTTSSIVGRARAPVITLREGEYGYRGPGLKPRVSPIAAAAAVFLRFIIQPSVFQTPANARTVTPMLRVVSRRFVGTRGSPRPRRGPNATPTLRGVTSERGEI